VAWWFVAVIAVGTVGSLIGEWQQLRLRFFAKPLASSGFVALAVSLGATDTTYGRWVLAALLFGWLGDVALMGSSRRAFLAGLVAFLIGHLLYVAAFIVAGWSTIPTLVAAVGVTIAAVVVFRWLRPHLPAEMRIPVVGYVVIISAMLATAVGATAAGATVLILVGAVAFYLSDLAVARNRFVSPDVLNRVWGLPLYYLGQILLAWSVA
jgi:uncharacterized membrane protein YhhN